MSAHWKVRNIVFQVFIAVDDEAKALIKAEQIALRPDLAILVGPILRDELQSSFDQFPAQSCTP